MGPVSENHPTLNMQAFITLALVAAASAAPQYAAAPVVHAVAGYAAPDLAEPSPYTYTYAVADDYSQANFQQSEANDGTGAVTGSYSVNLPDGRIQTVTYNANDITGNVATAPVHAVHAVAHPVVHHAPVLTHAIHASPLVHAAPVHAVHHGLAHGVVAHGGLVHHG